MEREIQEALRDIQSEHPVRIISAREMGSRMMGVPHEGSDYDVMFIYCFDEPWKYVARGHSKETMTIEEEPLEFHGWNINKFAKHYMDSNPTVIEFLSGDVYREESALIWRELERDIRENFNHMALYHHYISLAKSNYTQYVKNGNNCTIGRQFYIMRAAALARYVRVVGDMPKMDTYEFLDEAHPSALSREEYNKLEWLADQKSRGNGNTEHPDVVGDFFRYEQEMEMQPTDERTNSPSQDAINDLIREMLQ